MRKAQLQSKFRTTDSALAVTAAAAMRQAKKHFMKINLALQNLLYFTFGRLSTFFK
jgi:hypothetical protein